jgi:hypothetical protein
MKRMNSFYKSLLLLSLAVMPSAALAVEPVIDGAKATGDVLVEAFTTWRSLLSTQVVIPAGSVFHCEVTCTSEVNVPNDLNSDNQYFYAAFNNNLANNPTIGDGCVRQFDTAQGDSIDEIDDLAVASTCFIPGLSGTQTFYCLGRKVEAADLDLTIDSTSMHVICVDNQG